ncbi:hypothetical protein LOZ66_003211 [Ophidiomyces ophidiicola]|nr:hypothetical protein LOZ66_003211 [Ophidiomyces ophidiicola]
MGFRCCPRLLRGTGEKRITPIEGPPSDAISPRLPDDACLDQEALEIIFGQSNDNGSPLELPCAATVGLVDEKTPRKKRASMSRLSNKIREKFSREGWLAKKPFTDGEATGESEIGINNATSDGIVSHSADTLAAMISSDGGYDSDARNILTPQIIAQLAAGQSGNGLNPSQGVLSIESTQTPPNEFPNTDNNVASSPDDSTPKCYVQALAEEGNHQANTNVDKQTESEYISAEVSDKVWYANTTPTRKPKCARENDDLTLLETGKQASPLRNLEGMERNTMPYKTKANNKAIAINASEPLIHKKMDQLQDNRTVSTSVYSDYDSQGDDSPLGHRNKIYESQNVTEGFNNAVICKGAPKGPEIQGVNNAFNPSNGGKATVSSGPTLALHHPRVRPRSTVKESGEEAPAAGTSSPCPVKSRFTENFHDDGFFDSPAGIGVEGDGKGEPKNEPRKTSEGWLSGGKRLGYNYDFISRGSSLTAPNQDELGPNEQGLAVLPVVKEADIENAERSQKENIESEVTVTELPNSKRRTSDGQNKKNGGVFPRLSVFSKTRKRQASSVTSNATEATVSEVRGPADDIPTDISSPRDNETEGTVVVGKGARLFKKWKMPSISSGTNRHEILNESTKYVSSHSNHSEEETITSDDGLNASEQAQNGHAADLSHASTENCFHSLSSLDVFFPVENQELIEDDEIPAQAGIPETAEAWSLMYENCVDGPAVTDCEFLSTISGGSNCAQYAPTINDELGSEDSGGSTRAQYAQTIHETVEVGVELDGSELRESTTEFQAYQIANEASMRAELLQMVNERWG